MMSMTIAAAIFTAGLAGAAGQEVARAFPAAPPAAASNIIREISDPSTGDRWLLERDPAAPGGPGRLVRLSAGEGTATQDAGGQSRDDRTLPSRVIRAGDRVAVEEHTAVMDAELEGVALNGARSGASLRVRLKIGGKVVNAVALGPGRVAVTAVTGARP